jgi:hypothetical protein
MRLPSRTQGHEPDELCSRRRKVFSARGAIQCEQRPLILQTLPHHEKSAFKVECASVLLRRGGLVVRVPGCRSRGPGSIPGAGEVVGPLSCLEEKVAASVWKPEYTAVGIHRADHVTPLISAKLAVASPTKVGTVRSRTKATELLFLLETFSQEHV